MSSTIPQKQWFDCTLDLFVHLQTHSSIDQNLFIREASGLTQLIQKLAVVKFAANEQEIAQLANKAFTDISKAPQWNRLKVLIGTDLFQLIISTKLPSINTKDHDYYKDHMIPKQFLTYAARHKINLDFIKNNPLILNWICEANETQQLPEERREMRKTMKKIPIEYQKKTFVDRIKIGERLNSKLLCEEVICMLQKTEQKGQPSPQAQEIYEQYLNCLINPAGDDFREFVIKNLVVSLTIRSRQFV